MFKQNPFENKSWMTLVAKVFSLVLTVSLMLPMFAANAVPSELEGYWELVEGVDAPLPHPFELSLDDGHDFGEMACNAYFGNYDDLFGADTCSLAPIRFTPQASTRVGCPENEIEQEYIENLQSVDSYEVCEDQLTLNGRFGPLIFTRLEY